MSGAQEFLAAINENPAAINEQRIALALSGILAAVLEAQAREDREESLVRLHDTADAALGRVLALADTLDANPRATLKPRAFGELAAAIRKAVEETQTDG